MRKIGKNTTVKPAVSYKTILGLNRAPFSPQVDNKFYYAFPSFEQRLQVLKQLVQGRDFLIMVIGEKGSGKTTLLNQFMVSADDNWSTCTIRAHSKTDNKNSQLLENLDGRPSFILSDKQTPIVMIDDAHELTGIELKYLLQKTQSFERLRKPNRLLLFCEPRIKTTMNSLTESIPKEIVINKVYMPPINEAEAAEYLLHRLNIAGFTGKNPFRLSDIRAICRASDGLPGLINEKAHKLLLRKYYKKVGRDSFRISSLFSVRSFGLVASLVVLLSLAKFLLFQNSNTPELVPKKYIKPVPKIQVEDKKRKPARTTSVEQVIKTTDIKVGKSAQAPSKPIDILKSPEPISLTKARAVKKESSISSSAPTEKVKKTGENTLSSVIVEKGIYRESWILAQNPSYYTIQILGVRDEKAVLKFVGKHRLWNQAAYFQSNFKGKDWFSLLYGLYPTSKEALLAKEKLPEEIRKLSPWIRKMASVHNAITDKK
jgi:type II secretory pathway predicted ATPase ExeA